MSNAELIPRIELIEIARIRFHEHPEGRRTRRLAARFRQEGVLRNPPVVAEIGPGDYLLLDGANRVSAFSELGYSVVPVQTVDYADPAIELKGWHHLLVEAQGLGLEDAFAALPGVAARPVARQDLAQALEQRVVYAVWMDETTHGLGLYPRDPGRAGDVRERIAAASRIIGCYEGKSALERLKLADYSNLPAVLEKVEHQLCLFPLLTKEELLRLVREGMMIPTGITRHLIPGRALGLNLDLGFLAESDDLETKRAHLRAHVERIEVEGRARYYEEPVFIMNE